MGATNRSASTCLTITARSCLIALNWRHNCLANLYLQCIWRLWKLFLCVLWAVRESVESEMIRPTLAYPFTLNYLKAHSHHWDWSELVVYSFERVHIASSDQFSCSNVNWSLDCLWFLILVPICLDQNLSLICLKIEVGSTSASSLCTDTSDLSFCDNVWKHLIIFVGHRRLMRLHGEGLSRDCTFRCRRERRGSRLSSCLCHDRPTAWLTTISQRSATKLKVWCVLCCWSKTVYQNAKFWLWHTRDVPDFNSGKSKIRPSFANPA